MKKLTVTSPGFEAEGLIPVEHTGYGMDVSPELRLHDIEEGAVSLAIILDDIGHPIPNYNHWVIWNIPVMEVIPGGIPHGEVVESLRGAVQGCGYGKHRYRGPKPPFRWSHRYRFTVYVLDCFLELPGDARKRTLLDAMAGQIIQQGELIGHYR